MKNTYVTIYNEDTGYTVATTEYMPGDTYPFPKVAGWELFSDGLDGFGGFTGNVQSDNYASENGGEVHGVQVGVKTRTIRMGFAGPCVDQYGTPATVNEVRDWCAKQLSGMPRVTVTVAYLGKVGTFSGTVTSVELSAGNIYEQMTLTVSVTSASPYIKLSDISSSDSGTSDSFSLAPQPLYTMYGEIWDLTSVTIPLTEAGIAYFTSYANAGKYIEVTMPFGQTLKITGSDMTGATGSAKLTKTATSYVLVVKAEQSVGGKFSLYAGASAAEATTEIHIGGFWQVMVPLGAYVDAVVVSTVGSGRSNFGTVAASFAEKEMML